MSNNNASPRPWRLRIDEVGPEFTDVPIVDANGDPVVQTDAGCYPPDNATAALIVEAVNANEAWREERRRLQLAAASAEAAFDNADARRTLLERHYCEVFAERDRLRDLVRRLLPLAEIAEKYADADDEAIKGICALKGVDSSVVDAIRAANADLFREARAAIGEGM